MRRLSKAKKGKGAASDNSKESAQDAETQSNENLAPSDEEESSSEKRSSLNPNKKNKRGKKSTAVKSDPDNEDSGSLEEDENLIINKKNKRGRRNNAMKNEGSDNDSSEDVPLKGKGKKPKKGQKNNDHQAEGEKEGDDKEEAKKDDYEVEKVVGCRKHFGTKQFRIRWKGFGEDQDTWESETDLNCTDLIEEFLAANPEAFKKTAKVAGKSGAGRKRKTPANSAQPKEKKQRVVDPVAEEGGEKVYEVEKVMEVHFKKNGEKEFLIRWKGFNSEDDTWEPESNLHCKELIEKFMDKVKRAKEVTVRELRTNPQITNRFALNIAQGKRHSSRNTYKQRATYYNAE